MREATLDTLSSNSSNELPQSAAKPGHWANDPQLREVDSYGESLAPFVESLEYGGVGSWEEERALLIGIIRHLVLEVRDLFERVAEHDDDLLSRRDWSSTTSRH